MLVQAKSACPVTVFSTLLVVSLPWFCVPGLFSVECCCWLWLGWRCLDVLNSSFYNSLGARWYFSLLWIHNGSHILCCYLLCQNSGYPVCKLLHGFINAPCNITLQSCNESDSLGVENPPSQKFIFCCLDTRLQQNIWYEQKFVCLAFDPRWLPEESTLSHANLFLSVLILDSIEDRLESIG